MGAPEPRPDPAPCRFRTASRADLPAIAAIYNEEVLQGTSTWATEPVTLEERAAWLAAHPPERHPALVAEVGGEVAGWASLSPWNARGGWSRTVEVSVYVAGAWRRRGVGPLLLEEACRRGAWAGHRVALALVSADNVTSLRMCRQAAFVEAGRMRGVGHKFGRVLDCVLLQRNLRCRAGAVVRDAQGRTLWVRREAEGRRWWILPGGHVEAGEWPEDTARRELLEEAGLRVRLGPLGYRVIRRGRLQLYFAAAVESQAGPGGQGPEFTPEAALEHGTYALEWLRPEEVAARSCLPAGIAGALAQRQPWPSVPRTLVEDPEEGASGTGR